MFDPDGIHRALLNIASNALDAVQDNSDGELLFCRSRYDIASSEVTVTNNGKEFHPISMNRCFRLVSEKGEVRDSAWRSKNTP